MRQQVQKALGVLIGEPLRLQQIVQPDGPGYTSNPVGSDWRSSAPKAEKFENRLLGPTVSALLP